MEHPPPAGASRPGLRVAAGTLTVFSTFVSACSGELCPRCDLTLTFLRLGYSPIRVNQRRFTCSTGSAYGQV